MRRVLRKDGVLFLNLGDCYANDAKSNNRHPSGPGLQGAANQPPVQKRWRCGELKKKDLIGIPWMAAFALRKDGWYLRQELIWEKPNAMPESVTDRCSRSHETVFMLSASANYHYDAQAIAEPAVTTSAKRWTDGGKDKQRGHSRYAEKIAKDGPPTHRNRRSVWRVSTCGYEGAHFAVMPP